ncbi:MAG: hypothetical protein AAB388_02150 [Patescibacteria group bacterium]
MKIFNLNSALALLVGALLVAGSLGITHHMMNMSGDTADCPFMPGISVCLMSPLEMVAASQSFLSGVTLTSDSALLLFLISSALVLATFFGFFSPPRGATRFKIRKQKHRTQFNFLEEAFSNGILNPKLY